MLPGIIVQIREAEDLEQPLDQDLRPATFLSPPARLCIQHLQHHCGKLAFKKL